MKITLSDIIGYVALFLLGLAAAYAFLWAAEKEESLGIAGMSSERILVREEIKNSKPIPIRRPKE